MSMLVSVYLPLLSARVQVILTEWAAYTCRNTSAIRRAIWSGNDHLMTGVRLEYLRKGQYIQCWYVPSRVKIAQHPSGNVYQLPILHTVVGCKVDFASSSDYFTYVLYILGGIAIKCFLCKPMSGIKYGKYLIKGHHILMTNFYLYVLFWNHCLQKYITT